MTRTIAIGVVILTFSCAGCCGRWWEDSQQLHEVPPDRVVIYSAPPIRPYYFERGTVSSPGGPDSDPAANYRTMQRRAACLGAHGVILTDQMPPSEPDFWKYPHTGVAIVYATSSL